MAVDEEDHSEDNHEDKDMTIEDAYDALGLDSRMCCYPFSTSSFDFETRLLFVFLSHKGLVLFGFSEGGSGIG